jgi:CRISPR-associated protein Cas5t
MLCLYIEAPFAVFRTFTAGSFRPTAGFITPSAAYGLLLNLAGIEMRHDDGKSVMTLIKTDLPTFQLAIGAVEEPEQHSVYQQLHNYPVGSSGKEHAPNTKGNKYNITPVRRSFLSNLKAYLCIKDNEGLEAQIQQGINGEIERQYGLPFLGDNNFLIDKIRIEQDQCLSESKWYVPINEESELSLYGGVTRLTKKIDRKDLSQTQSALFAPLKKSSTTIPTEAWVEVGY